MWIGKAPWATLARDARWSVDLFASLDAPSMTSPHPRVRLAELVAERRESLLPGRWPDFAFCYLGLEHVTGQTGLLERFAPKLGREVQSASGVFRRGDVLYGRLRPYLNKVYLAEGRVHTGICSGEFFVLTPDRARVRPLFLRELLASAYVADAVKGMQLGSALPRLQLEDLLKLEVPIPSLDAQASLERALLEARDALRASLAVSRTAGAAIRGAFERALSEGGDWRLDPADAALEAPAAPNALPAEYVALARGARGARVDRATSRAPRRKGAGRSDR